MESEIQELVLGYRRETKEDHGNTENADKKRNKDNKDDTDCQWCHDCPCVWSSSRNGVIEYDKDTWLAWTYLVTALDVSTCTNK
jgi:hypothetical protein